MTPGARLPILLRRLDAPDDFDLAILDPENITHLVGPAVSFIQGIRDFTAAEKNLAIADIGIPLEVAGHPYLVF
jgi:hypothetical protein